MEVSDVVGRACPSQKKPRVLTRGNLLNISSNRRIKKLFKLAKYGARSFLDRIGLLGLTGLALFPMLAAMLESDGWFGPEAKIKNRSWS